jgi:hypothetical protein
MARCRRDCSEGSGPDRPPPNENQLRGEVPDAGKRLQIPKDLIRGPRPEPLRIKSAVQGSPGYLVVLLDLSSKQPRESPHREESQWRREGVQSFPVNVDLLAALLGHALHD